MSANLTISGLKELQRAFKVLPRVGARKVTRQGLRAGAKVVAAKVKENTPHRSGDLARDVKVRALQRKKPGVIGVEVRMGDGHYKGDRFYGAFVDLGTKDQRAQGFLERSADEAKGEASAVVARTIADGIVRELANA